MNEASLPGLSKTPNTTHSPPKKDFFSLSSLPNSNTLDWPEVFFALTCLALNSITQPSGRMCFLPSPLRFVVRSSPVFCGLDALSVIAVWLHHILWDWDPPTRAAARIVRSRFSSNEFAEKGEIERTAGMEVEMGTGGSKYGDSFIEKEGFTSSRLERNFAFRCAVFGFGVLPQSVKLFACSGEGIVWVQAIGGVYLVSWAVLEVLMLCAARSRDTRYESALTVGEVGITVPEVGAGFTSTSSTLLTEEETKTANLAPSLSPGDSGVSTLVSLEKEKCSNTNPLPGPSYFRSSTLILEDEARAPNPIAAPGPSNFTIPTLTSEKDTKASSITPSAGHSCSRSSTLVSEGETKTQNTPSSKTSTLQPSNNSRPPSPYRRLRLTYTTLAILTQILTYSFSNLPLDYAAAWTLRISHFLFAIPFWAAIIHISSLPASPLSSSFSPLRSALTPRWHITSPIAFVYNLSICLGLAIRWWTLYPGPSWSEASMNSGTEWDGLGTENTSARDVVVVVLLSSVVPMLVAVWPVMSLWVTNILFPLAFLEAVYQAEKTSRPWWTGYLG